MASGELGSAAFQVGQGARIGNIEVGGNVAGRDVVVGVTAAEASAVKDRQEVLALLTRLQDQVAALAEAPSSLRDDAHDELRKAKEAGEQGNTDRLVEKLETAHGYLERIAATLPAAIGLAQAVATLGQRVIGLA